MRISTGELSLRKGDIIMQSSAIKTPLGAFHAFADDHGLCRLLFPESPRELFSTETRQSESTNHPVFKKLARQLNQYLRGERRIFDLSIAPKGTPFQMQVWQLLLQIPYGETKSYGDLATGMGNINKARAVGGAAHVNPLPIIIPCHRLIGKNSNLTGYAGGLKIKKYLLELEHKTST